MHIIKQHFNWRHQALIFVLTMAMTVGGFVLLDFVELEHNIATATHSCVTDIFYENYSGFMGPGGCDFGGQRIESGTGGGVSSCAPGSERRGFVSFNTGSIPDSNTISSAYMRLRHIDTNVQSSYYATSFGALDNGDYNSPLNGLMGTTTGSAFTWANQSVTAGSINKTGNTQYTFRRTGGGVTRFETSATYRPELHVTHCTVDPPTVTTLAASSITSTSVTLNGQADPNGNSTTGFFRYSSTNPGSCNGSFGTRVPSSGGDALGSGTNPVSYSRTVSGLTPNTTYYYCARASNSGGTSGGSLVSFTTTPPPSSLSILCNSTPSSCSIAYNATATIAWSSTGFSSCSFTQGSGSGTWSGTSGSQTTPSLTSTQTYTVSCDSGAQTASVVVNVAAPTTFNVSGFIYEDLNANGTKDAGETGSAFVGSVIEIRLQSNNSLVANTTTDSSGYFYIPGLLSGNYLIVLANVPAGYQVNQNNVPFSL